MTDLLRHDHIEWPTEKLQERLGELHVNNKNIVYTGERLLQVQKEIGLISLELSCRYRDERGEIIDGSFAE